MAPDDFLILLEVLSYYRGGGGNFEWQVFITLGVIIGIITPVMFMVRNQTKKNTQLEIKVENCVTDLNGIGDRLTSQQCNFDQKIANAFAEIHSNRRDSDAVLNSLRNDLVSLRETIVRLSTNIENFSEHLKTCPHRKN